MWDVSADFLAQLRTPHDVTVAADVYYAGILVQQGLAVESGNVSVDEGSNVRRSAQITISDPSLDPAGVIDLLAPFGTEIVLRRGVMFGNGDVENIPLGVFRIDEARRSSWYSGVEIQASDRSNVVQEARFIKPWNTNAGVEIRTEIESLIRDVLPNIEFYDLTDDDSPTTAGVWEDRWVAIEKLSASLGAELIFDNLGRAVLRPVATAADEPVWTVDAGSQGVMLDVRTGISRAEVYNAVVATGDPQDGSPPVVGYAYVNSGPLLWGGPFGKKPRFFSSQFISTVNQATTAARSILARSTGFSRTIEPTSIVNPALDVGDTITIVLPDGRSYNHVIRSLSIPLAAEDTMEIGTRVVDEGTFALEGTLD